MNDNSKPTFYLPGLSRNLAQSLQSSGESDEAATTEACAMSLIADAIGARASDIHLDSQPEEVCVRFRVDGIVLDIASIPRDRGQRLIRYFKVTANLDPIPALLPADSHCQFEFEERSFDVRLACAPCVYGDKLALRLLQRSPIRLHLADLGLAINERLQIEEWLGDISGMFVVAGPAGSGKTTTLYALLAELNLTQRNIVTIEDPVEYQLGHLNQIEVNVARGLTFERGMRSILRLDPDYILLGEIRDKESALIAMEAAATGRVLLTTMHARNAAGVITALRSLNVSNYEIAASLAFVLSQRLVRKLCRRCRMLSQPTDQEKRWLESIGQAVPDKAWHAPGCEKCGGTGYFERTGVFEILPVNEKVYNFILNGKDEHALRRHLREEDHRLLLHDGLQKAASGMTDLSELTRIGAQSFLEEAGH
jgi:general secretion pathway protein E